MATIGQAAKYVRSKNAGPFWMTIDIFFDGADEYEALKAFCRTGQEQFSKVYGVSAEMVKVYCLDAIKVIKISIPRQTPQGGKYERDMHSGQQYVQILGLEI